MIQAEKNMKRRSSYLPISIGWVLKIAFIIAGIALWGWAFVAVVVGLYIGFEVLKGLLSCLLSLLIIAVVITLLVVIIF
ncbi:MAG: hypothetical protein EZS26_002505 [Candidatus Ordinivivax streblomastigis]|jgi:hypothetical protein|uniref:Uncharacterized protein n=1 Tax=Candidatus Ordinivivax streblomastigis TaxID=2540710 RepID=A0A5M8NXL4_9BACT|nr:MAG: hypothetical protein EZS26_002505 [Candidatus Ordinivivax streblomastigis]